MMHRFSLSTSCEWAPSPMHLADDEVHVWNADLDLRDECLASLKMLLEPSELAHAARYRSVQHAQHYIAGRGMLRMILAQYVGMPPADLRFDYTVHGKPFLIPDKGLDPVAFNVAHSGGVVVYAIARGRAVGIDIETVRHDIDHEQIAERFFSDGERSALSALPASVRVEAFYRCWVRKEAYIKASGEGLALALNRFSVSLRPGEPAQLLWAEQGMSEVLRWSLYDLPLASGYVGSLVVEGHGWSLC